MPIRIEDAPNVLPNVRGGGGFANPMRGTTGTDIVARQAQDIGRAVQGASGKLGDIVEQEQLKANKVRLNDAYNQALSAAHALRYSKDKGYTNIKGAAALKGVQGDDGSFRPLSDSYGEQLDKALSDIRRNLGNQAIQADFDMLASDLGAKFRGEALTYEVEQSKAYEQDVRDATVISAANEASVIAPTLTSPDAATRAAADQKLAFHTGRALDAAKQSARAKGYAEGDEAFDAFVRESMGKAHAAVIDSLIDRKDIGSAKAYFAKYEKDFPALQADDVRAKLSKAYSAAVAVTAADEVISANGGMKPLDRAIDIDKMHADLRTRFKDDPEALQAARQELDYRYAIQQRQQKEYDDGNVSAVWKSLLAGESLASVEGSRAWLALPGDTQASLKNAYGNYRDGNVPDAMVVGWFEKMADENWLAQATPSEIEALLPFFGQARTAQLFTASEHAKARAAGGVAKAQLDQPNVPAYMVDAIATQLGLKPASSNADDKVKVVRLQTDLYNLAARTQMATGKIIPPGEMDAFLRNNIARFMSADYLRQHPDKYAKLPLPTVGSEANKQIAAQLARKGLPPTVENQRAAWLEVIEAGIYLVDE